MFFSPLGFFVTTFFVSVFCFLFSFYRFISHDKCVHSQQITSKIRWFNPILYLDVYAMDAFYLTICVCVQFERRICYNNMYHMKQKLVQSRQNLQSHTHYTIYIFTYGSISAFMRFLQWIYPAYSAKISKQTHPQRTRKGLQERIKPNYKHIFRYIRYLRSITIRKINEKKSENRMEK